jgi:aminoglycoside phosphotransferase (APT) family kinase protein
LSTPAPAALAALDPIGVALDEPFSGWRRLSGDRAAGDPLEGLDPWSRRHLQRLAAIEADWTDGAAGDALLHLDIRSDNVLLTETDEVVFVDWANATVGAPWVDHVLMLPSVTFEGGPPPEDMVAASSHVAGAGEDAVTAVVVAFAGYLTARAREPAPPGLPWVRGFQAAQGEIARAWVAERTGLD